MDYKGEFYDNYVSGHTSSLYGEISLGGIKSQFPAWESYFGKLLPENKDAKILDIGCGYGGFVCWLREKGFKNAEGVDISREQIELGRKLGIEGLKEVDLHEILGKGKGSYDALVARDILEHFSKNEVVDVLKLAQGALSNGGVCLIQTANAENLLWGRLRHGDFTHDIAFTEQSIRQVLGTAGFKDVRVFPQRPVVHGVASFIRLALWFLVELALHAYLLVETGSARGIFTQNIIVSAKKGL